MGFFIFSVVVMMKPKITMFLITGSQIFFVDFVISTMTVKRKVE